MVCLTPGRLTNMRPDTAVNTQNIRLKMIRTGKTLNDRKYFQSNLPFATGRLPVPGPGMVKIPKIFSAISTMAAVDMMAQVYNSVFPLYAADTAKKVLQLIVQKNTDGPDKDSKVRELKQ